MLFNFVFFWAALSVLANDDEFIADSNVVFFILLILACLLDIESHLRKPISEILFNNNWRDRAGSNCTNPHRTVPFEEVAILG